MNLAGKKVLVLGLGDSGLSMVRWLVRHGAQIRAADSRTAPPHAARLREQLPQVEIALGPFAESLFQGVDLIAISPGVALSSLPPVQVPVVGDVELFALALQQAPRKAKVIAITGANGKTTVTSLCGAMCKESGAQTVVAGNIGLPVLDALGEIEDGKPMPEIFVLELSSFQLETTSSLAADAATVLNVTQDHMDRYSDMNAYAAAKERIFQGCGMRLVNREDDYSAAMASKDGNTQSFGLNAPANDAEWGITTDASGEEWLAHGNARLMPCREIPLAGRHNAANALAALALCSALGLPMQASLKALREFKGLPHRVEKVNEIAGVVFYDDSKGTNVGATVAALNGMREPVVLIAGGDGKGQDFSPLKPACTAHARSVVLIGRDAPQIARALEDCGVHIQNASDMEQAVRLAFAASQPGDAVLLSPACASFDMFRNYEHRAQVFIAAVQKLQEERAA